GACGSERPRSPQAWTPPGPGPPPPAPTPPTGSPAPARPPPPPPTAGGEFVGGQARALAAAPRDDGARPRGGADRQHAGAGLPLRPRAPLPRLPRPRRVRARPRGAPDLLRPAPAPARRLAGGDHRGDPGAGERGRPGDRK